MQVVNTTWAKHLQATAATARAAADPVVLFTTESKKMVQEQKEFVSNPAQSGKYAFDFNFVTNTRDVHPDSGFMKDIARRREEDRMDADEVMLSAISSLQAQLVPRATVGNCCSNFHALLNDFLMEGCGAASENTYLCLQEYEEDPALRVCCGWHHDCKEAKRMAIEEERRKKSEKAV
jgi:hypothetical protein